MTDGRRWEIYETHRPVPMADKLVVAFDLADHSSANVVFKAIFAAKHEEGAEKHFPSMQRPN